MLSFPVGFNRTNVELKSNSSTTTTDCTAGFNRTNVELKYKQIHLLF